MYRFGEFELDIAGRDLRRHFERVHLEPQAFDLLAYLIAHRDRVISKIELMDEVWGHQFLSEANLTTRVKEIRQAVGDDGRQQHTIKNVRGRGYRFVASVDVDERPLRRSIGTDSKLIGRHRDATAIVAALAESALVTITGPGGVGKSTLATSLANELNTAYPDGVHVAEFVALANDEYPLATVARVLGIVFDADYPEITIRAIARLNALLVFDNCEHICDAASDLVQRLHAVAGARVQILATSQVRLGLSGEAVVRINSLELVPATELFCTRALAVAPDWDMQSIGAHRVEAVVAAMDRLPLTVEMAAARLGSMTFDDLELVIGEGAPMLHVNHRTPTRRHRSLESLVTWSVELLNPQERDTFTKFAVFADDVGINDACAILGPDPQSSIGFDLSALADHSLLVADVSGSETRYAMLTTVRTVATRWFEASLTADDIKGRHAQYFADVLVDIDDQLRTPNEIEGRRRLDAIIDEVRAAYRWAINHRPDLASRMSASLVHATNSSLWLEPSVWSQALLDQQTETEATHFHGAKLMAAAAAAHRGQLRLAREHASAVAAASEGRVRAIALELLADVALYEGDLHSALRNADALSQLGSSLEDSHALAFGAVDTALAHTYAGDPLQALNALDACQLGAIAPSDQAWLAYARGDALSAMTDSAARNAFMDAIELGGGVGNHFVVSVAHTSLATELARCGDVELAFDTFSTSLRNSLRHGNLTHAVTAIRSLLRLLATVGDDRGATELAGAMSDKQLRASYGTEAAQIADALTHAERRVGANQFVKWFQHGTTFDLHTAAQRAVELAEQHRKPGSANPHSIHK